jgi:hypothetical protein
MATSVFRVGSFRSFFVGQACSYLGDGLRAIAFPLLVFQLTGSAMSLVRNFGPDIITGWTFIMRDPAMHMLTWIQLVYNFFLMLGFTTIIPYFKRDFLATDQQVGIAFGIFALGSVIGSIAAGKWHPSFGRVFIVTNIVGVFAGIPMLFTHD